MNYKARHTLQVKVKQTDEQVTSSETLQDDNELLLPVKPSRTYFILLNLIFKCHANVDIKIAFTIPSGAVLSCCGGAVTANNPVVDVDMTSAIATGTDDTLQHMTYQGYLTVSTTPGTLQFQFAQNVSGAETTIVKAGTTLMLMESQ